MKNERVIKPFIIEQKWKNWNHWTYHKTYWTLKDAETALKHLTESSGYYWEYRIVERAQREKENKQKTIPVEKPKRKSFIQWLFSKI